LQVEVPDHDVRAIVDEETVRSQIVRKQDRNVSPGGPVAIQGNRLRDIQLPSPSLASLEKDRVSLGELEGVDPGNSLPGCLGGQTVP